MQVRVISIGLVDHIIFNPQSYFSFLEAGRLPNTGG
jgi:DNA repair protein RadC